MIRKPNALQKLVHRFIMLRPVSAFFAPRVHRLDQAILKLTRGKHTLSEILGWDIIQLTSIGAKTGRPHTMPLVGLVDGEKIALIASSFGRKHNPAWYYNLKAKPQVTVQIYDKVRTVTPQILSGERRARAWQKVITTSPMYARYETKTSREIPLIFLPVH